MELYRLLKKEYPNSIFNLKQVKDKIVIEGWKDEKDKPNEDDIKNLWVKHEKEIKNDIALEKLKIKHYVKMVEKIFEDYKKNDNDYKNELKDIK